MHESKIMLDGGKIANRAARPDNTGDVPKLLALKCRSLDGLFGFSLSLYGFAEREFAFDKLCRFTVNSDFLFPERVDC